MRSFRQRFRQSAKRVMSGVFGENAVLVRQSAGQRERGKFVPGLPKRVDLSVSAESVSMSSPEEVRSVLPEGARLDAARLFFIPVDLPGTISPLRVGPMPTGPDVIEYRGHSYTLLSIVGDYAEFGHIEVVGLRPDRDRANS